MGRRKQAITLDRLRESSIEHARVVLATGRFIGEGFDDARVDSSFLAMPISCCDSLCSNTPTDYIATTRTNMKYESAITSMPTCRHPCACSTNDYADIER
jgi:hypothetical protein